MRRQLAGLQAATATELPRWRVLAEYDWDDDTDSGSGSMSFPAVHTLDAARHQLATYQTDPQRYLRRHELDRRTFRGVRWHIRRIETWALFFDEEAPDGPPQG
jgi:hypothetical protein